MISRKSCLTLKFLSIGLAVFLLFFPVLAQDDDPNPDSPTPVLLSEPDSTRALTELPSKIRRGNQIKVPNKAFLLDSQITLYVTNIELMKGEGANAFRVYVEDVKGRAYRFPVLDLQSVKGFDGVFALTVKLHDEIGYWEPPSEDGDVLVNVTWRGLTSNRVRLGLGKPAAKSEMTKTRFRRRFREFRIKKPKLRRPIIQVIVGQATAFALWSRRHSVRRLRSTIESAALVCGLGWQNNLKRRIRRPRILIRTFL